MQGALAKEERSEYWVFKSLGAHVSVEVTTHATSAIRYCIKYITKGSDQIMFAVQPDGAIDEIAQFQHSRYLGVMEAAWRLLDRPIHGHHPVAAVSSFRT